MILIDTGPLVALCDARDSRHKTAARQLARLPAPIGTCEAVMTEAGFHLPHRSQRQRLRALIDALDVLPVSGGEERGFWTDVLTWLAKYADHEPDWADGCIAVLSGRNDRLKVWTYDREFRTTWRRANGTPIPLAV